eukprot:1655373-Pleurochrysis_carterae.AAC.1
MLPRRPWIPSASHPPATPLRDSSISALRACRNISNRSLAPTVYAHRFQPRSSLEPRGGTSTYTADPP